MKPRLRLLATGLSTLLLPSSVARWALNALGHAVGPRVRIGFSVLLIDRLVLQAGTRIGHANALQLRRLVMREGAYIGRGNLARGPFSIGLGSKAAIGNANKITRGSLGLVVSGPASLRLGELSKITSDHRIDCTATVHIGSFSTIAGTGSELWTHGYVHALQGAGRYRVDGRIRIGNNVYVGSSCIITTGVSLANGVIVGAGATVARSLTEPGMYVSAALRRLDRPGDPDIRADLLADDSPELCERVYIKRP